MVSSGQVNSDSGSLVSILSEYNAKVSSLTSCWKGASSDNLQAKASEFYSQFSSAIESQMTAFATACNLYEQYKLAKDNLEIVKGNYNIAVSNEDAENVSFFSSEITKYTNEMNNLKSKIESNLQTASSSKLDSGGGSGAAGGAGSASNSPAKSAVSWATQVANDDSHGYSQSNRNGNPDYDCSSFVISAYDNAGVPVKESGASYTGDMKSAFVDQGFTWTPGNPSVDDLKPGDVLLKEGVHTEMYVGDGKLVGAHDNYDGVTGDSSGKEISVGNYYSHPWDGVLRYEGDDDTKKDS